MKPPHKAHSRVSARLLAIFAVAALSACSSATKSATETPGTDNDTTVRLLAYDSFTPPPAVWEGFTKETGITVEVLPKGDTGTMLNTAIIAKDTPIADVIWGIDSTFLSRALSAGILRPHGLTGLPIESSLQPTQGAEVVVPVDQSEVCVNADTRAIPDAAMLSLQDLTKPELKGKLVVQNPASSAPGLAFLLATVNAFGETGWQDYWEQLTDNDVKVVNGWEESWNTEFSGAGSGTRPLVVSYSNSPAAFVAFGADPAATTTPIAVLEQSCIAVVEYAGLLGKEDNPAAKKVLEFLLSETFQSELALNLFVYPARSGVALPELYARLDIAPAPKPSRIDADRVQAMRDVWVDEWTEIVLG
jgi:thiamine transport system substrate-binding protein